MFLKFIRNWKLEIGNSRQGRGFTLLLSILVVSVILSVGLGIFDIMTKELKLSGIGRESQIAFYAADAGIECFFYWEIKHPDLVDSAFAYYDSNPPTISCAGNSFSIPAGSNGPYGPYNLNLSNNSCAKIKVTKSGLTTTVESRGYNTSCDSASSFKVERAIRLVSVKKQGGTASAPGVPGNIQAQVISQSQINLSWNAASDATNYLIYRGVNETNLSEIGGTAAISYSNTGLTDNTTYYYQVVASNSYGYTAESAIVSAKTKDYSSACGADGGDWVASQKTCYFSGTSCRAGWSPNESYSTTQASECKINYSQGYCQTTGCATGSHSRSNIGAETCSYYGFDGIGNCSWTFCYASYTEIGCKKN